MCLRVRVLATPIEKSPTRFDVEGTRRLLEFLTRRNRRSPSPGSCCIALADRRFLPNGHTVLSQHRLARFFTFRLTPTPIPLPLRSGEPPLRGTLAQHLLAQPPFLLFGQPTLPRHPSSFRLCHLSPPSLSSALFQHCENGPTFPFRQMLT